MYRNGSSVSILVRGYRSRQLPTQVHDRSKDEMDAKIGKQLTKIRMEGTPKADDPDPPVPSFYITLFLLALDQATPQP
jgi:hypothetical protein